MSVSVARGPGSWSRRSRSGIDPLAALSTARRIADELRDGLSGAGVRAAARGLRRLLGVELVGLTDLSGRPVWAPAPPSGARADAAADLIERVLHTETRIVRSTLVALPLHVRQELAGVLVVSGASSRAAAREAAAWIVDALERGRLEASAEQAATAELRALRAEISPHFVYNALTVIASLVSSEPDRSRELMIDFADYIRYSLARHGEYTTVADEFHAIETYLALQRAVLGERLVVQVRVAPEVLAVALPYLVLQPLVENAVRHGIEPRSGTGHVQVRGEAEGNDCVISVEDDGVGMDPTMAEAILAGHAGPDGEDASSDGATAGKVGLANVDRRLRNVYGAWFGLVVETAEGEGTRVVVRIPRFQPGVMP